ncbi:hypothetical protein BKA63DRAFT_573038 [Paraphoma chrysanthemicola]|nr:hypothetical protein BKA63DRAFT_573038 [Paraphoma chrysanthemicola]
MSRQLSNSKDWFPIVLFVQNASIVLHYVHNNGTKLPDQAAPLIAIGSTGILWLLWLDIINLFLGLKTAVLCWCSGGQVVCQTTGELGCQPTVSRSVDVRALERMEQAELRRRRCPFDFQE